MTSSNVLAVTDLTASSYELVGFAAFLAGSPGGQVVLVSTFYRGAEQPSAEAHLRQEGQLLESQRQWCANRGVRCLAELCEERTWSEFVAESARRSAADLILVDLQSMIGRSGFPPERITRLAADAPCLVSAVRVPRVWGGLAPNPDTLDIGRASF